MATDYLRLRKCAVNMLIIISLGLNFVKADVINNAKQEEAQSVYDNLSYQEIIEQLRTTIKQAKLYLQKTQEACDNQPQESTDLVDLFDRCMQEFESNEIANIHSPFTEIIQNVIYDFMVFMERVDHIQDCLLQSSIQVSPCDDGEMFYETITTQGDLTVALHREINDEIIQLYTKQKLQEIYEELKRIAAANPLPDKCTTERRRQPFHRHSVSTWCENGTTGERYNVK